MDKIKKIYKKLTIMGKISLLIFIIFLIMGVFSGKIARFPHDNIVAASFVSPNKTHLLGTDDLGMDIFAQILYGARVSIGLSLFVAIVSTLIGASVGIVAAYYGGVIDRLLIRLIDVLTIIPSLPILIIISSFWGPSMKNIVIILVLLSWISPARIIRSKTLQLKEEPYILVAEYYGAGFLHLTRKHFIIELVPIILVSIIKLISRTIVSEASLSFLGLGDPTNKTWGLVLNFALGFQAIYFTEYWKWWVLSPLLAIILLVLAVAFLSVDLEKIANTRL